MRELYWMEDLMEWAKYNEHYQECLAEVKRVEPGFLTLRESLTKEQQKTLEAYLSACEEMDRALMELACDMTRERIHEEFYHLMRVEAFYQKLGRDIQRSTAEGETRVRTPEYLEMCREFNRIALQIREETGEEIPLIELGEDEK